MEIAEIHVDDYEKVVRCRDPRSGLHAIIAVHDTTLGPALGGMRMLPYASEDDALFDDIRMTRGNAQGRGLVYVAISRFDPRAAWQAVTEAGIRADTPDGPGDLFGGAG